MTLACTESVFDIVKWLWLLLNYKNNNNMLGGDGFIFPKRKGKSRGRRKNTQTANVEVTEPVVKLKSKIHECLAEIKGSEFYAKFQESLHRCIQVLNSSDISKSTHCKITDNLVATNTTRLAENVAETSLRETILQTSSDTYNSAELSARCHPSQNNDRPTDAVTDIQDIICYGLGNFSSCVIARYQMALLLALRENLNVDLRHCHLYDPRFTEKEKDFIGEIGLRLITENEEGKRACFQRTLFYMPHCDKPLYNNLLYANWGLNLCNVVIIGNSFTTTVQSLPSRILKSEANFIHQIVPFTHEEPVDNNFRYTDIFNDTSLHCFPRDKLSVAEGELWETASEPKYNSDNLGIILKNDCLNC